MSFLNNDEIKGPYS